MKLAIINTVYHEGSTGAIAEGLKDYYQKEYQDTVYVYYGRGKKRIEKNVVKIESKFEVYLHAILARITGLQGYFSNRATVKLIKSLKATRPDAVILLNLHGYYLNEKKILNYLKKNAIRTVYIMPDEYPFLGKCCFAKNCEKYKSHCFKCPNVGEYPKSLLLDQSNRLFKMKKHIYDGFETISFIAPKFNIDNAKKSLLLKDKKLVEAPWGIDLESTYFYHKNTEGLKRKYGFPKDKRIVLAVAPFSQERKGIKEYFLECAKKTESQDLLFVNVGYDGPNDFSLPSNYIPMPYMKNQVELAEIYSCADVFVIVSNGETMPLASLIALGCGTPIIGFESAGMKDVITEGCGLVIESGNVKELLKAIETVPPKTCTTINRIRNYAISRFSDTLFYEKVRELAKNGE